MRIFFPSPFHASHINRYSSRLTTHAVKVLVSFCFLCRGQELAKQNFIHLTFDIDNVSQENFILSLLVCLAFPWSLKDKMKERQIVKTWSTWKFIYWAFLLCFNWQKLRPNRNFSDSSLIWCFHTTVGLLMKAV